MLRYLFVDMNAYFASVEQQDDPRLRGRPVVVTACAAETTCCIAASYEAKKYGIQTGTPVWEARQRCPALQLRIGRHARYAEVHQEIVRAVGRCLPVTKVMSIDEMACRLSGEASQWDRATAFAQQIKAEIRRSFDYLSCSIGIGPNVLLAKMASDMQKPDGLTILRTEDLPYRLPELALSDFPGIGSRMERRFHRQGIFTVVQLMQLTPAQMCQLWGSKVHGWRWWYLLRGDDVAEQPTKRRTLGHSRVLPPEDRNEAGAWAVLVELLHKTAARLQRLNYWAGGVIVSIGYIGRERWHAKSRWAHFQDAAALLQIVQAHWKRKPCQKPYHVGVTLTHLVPATAVTPSLFDPTPLASAP
ncbi:MAG: hypothetical protein LC104_14110 [Bacteroidales bacterium]|nr:hypothetical protein [Bacteroidales bacterium]